MGKEKETGVGSPSWSEMAEAQRLWGSGWPVGLFA